MSCGVVSPGSAKISAGSVPRRGSGLDQGQHSHVLLRSKSWPRVAESQLRDWAKIDEKRVKKNLTSEIAAGVRCLPSYRQMLQLLVRGYMNLIKIQRNSSLQPACRVE